MGFHGCEREIGEKALAGELGLLKSDRSYDWLGPGIYFWEADPVRAWEWAKSRQQDGKIRHPFAIGAVIDLGNCLDLTLRENLDLLSDSHKGLSYSFKRAGKELPKNKDGGKYGKGDKLLRFLDCAVIKYLHGSLESSPNLAYDTVRGLFVEGKPVYSGARFYRQTHTQIAVVTDNMIHGLFRVRGR